MDSLNNRDTLGAGDEREVIQAAPAQLRLTKAPRDPPLDIHTSSLNQRQSTGSLNPDLQLSHQPRLVEQSRGEGMAGGLSLQQQPSYPDAGDTRNRMFQAQPFTDEEIRIAFDEFDQKGARAFGAPEIKDVLEILGEKVTPEEIDEMIRMIDMDGDGKVDFKEFHRMATGCSLAPLGVALPPPRDLKEVKQLDKALAAKEEATLQTRAAMPTGKASRTGLASSIAAPSQPASSAKDLAASEMLQAQAAR